MAALVLLGVSCKEETIQSYNNLTAAEQQAIRDRAKQKCLDTYTSIYDRFKTNSGNVFSSSDYNRGKGFYFEYKVNTDVKRKADIRVWKRTSTDLYFYITETNLTAKSFFLKVSRVENEDMIDDILTDHCSEPKIYTSGSSSTGGPLTITYEYEIPNAPNDDRYTDVYSFPFTELAFFTNYRQNRTLKVIKSDDTVESTTSYVSTLATKTFTFNSNNYADTSYYVQSFCNIKKDASANKYRLPKELYGFEFECEPALPGGWDLSI